MAPLSEILAEVFKMRLSDVDEMTQNRFKIDGSGEDRLWPQDFRLK